MKSIFHLSGAKVNTEQCEIGNMLVITDPRARVMCTKFTEPKDRRVVFFVLKLG